MILLVHMLLGAVIGQKILNPVLAVVLAFFSHYFLDFFPHAEYPIENIVKKQWREALPQILNVILDFLSGILVILIFSGSTALPAGRQAIIYACAFFTILPDGLSLLNSAFNNAFLTKHIQLHQKKLHYFKYKKISNFWRILSQIIVVAVCVFLLRI